MKSPEEVFMSLATNNQNVLYTIINSWFKSGNATAGTGGCEPPASNTSNNNDDDKGE